MHGQCICHQAKLIMTENRWKNLDVWKLLDALAYKTYLVSIQK